MKVTARAGGATTPRGWAQRTHVRGRARGPWRTWSGVWIGSQGWELIAAPEGEPGGPESFTFIARLDVEIIGVNRTTVYRLVERGELPAVRLGDGPRTDSNSPHALAECLPERNPT